MLPQELFDEIVEWRFDDHPSLMALACTAQCLRRRSQALLFRDLYLSPNTRSPSSYIPLLEMSPHILAHVRRLHIVVADPSQSYFLCRNPNLRLYVDEDDALGRLIHAATNVDEITLLEMIGLRVALGNVLPIIASPRVRKLRLQDSALRDSQSLLTLLSYFPSVSSLCLDYVSVSDKTQPSLDTGNLCLTEMHLFMSMDLGVCLLKDATGGWSRHLRSLIVEDYTPKDLLTFAEVIPNLPNLVTLMFKCPGHDIIDSATQQELAAEISIFPLQRIRSFHLSLSGFHPAWTRWWLSHLTPAAALSLEYLAVDLVYEDGERLHSVAVWEDTEMTLMQLPKLKSVNTRIVRKPVDKRYEWY